MKRETIDLSKLRLDIQNARLDDEQENQDAALIALLRAEGQDILNLASDIVEQGALNPLDVIGVVPHPQQNDAFVVLEGNRRVVALMILESPQRAAPVLSAAERRTLDGLHRAFVKAPIEEVFCVVLKDPEDFNHWITLRHTGKNDGKGLSSWKPGGQDRYLARHGNQVPAPRTQVEQFVLSSGGLSAEAQRSGAGS